MDKINCEVCCDLIPLVADNVASDDSRQLVSKHIAECDSCRECMQSFSPVAPEINDKKILRKMKNVFALISFLVIIIGASLGVALSNSADVIYNIIIMPILGIVGYFAVKKGAFIIVASVLLLTLITVSVSDCFTDALYWSVIYAALSAIGILIAALLHYAFKKENKTK